VKEKIVYIAAFILAFALITGAIIYLNSIYKNIFKFDFTPETPTQNVSAILPVVNEQTAQPKDTSTVNKTLADSLKQSPAVLQKDSPIVTLSDTNSMEKVKDKIAEVKKNNEQNANSTLEQTNEATQKFNNSKKDSLYQKWIKNTAQLYYSMDTRKAAKIIQGYSDNIARDILLTMKKKKAADILAEFKPEVATRIISAKQ
jgi:flagellar motility protein MotE (MotC chaperone)